MVLMAKPKAPISAIISFPSDLSKRKIKLSGYDYR
jgi:hypothetical protein